MKKVLATSLFLFFVSPASVFAQGYCSNHGGVDCSKGPQSNGHVMCKDGNTTSSGVYAQIKECQGVKQTGTTQTTTKNTKTKTTNTTKNKTVKKPTTKKNVVKAKKTPTKAKKVTAKAKKATPKTKKPVSKVKKSTKKPTPTP